MPFFCRFPTGPAGGKTEFPFVEFEKIVAVVKPGGGGDLIDGEIGFLQQGAGVFHAQIQKILKGGGVERAAEAAQKLIDTGNLADYRIVAGAMFVRNDTEMTEEQALREAAACFSIPAAVSAGMTEGGMSRLAKYAAGLQQQAISNAADALPDLSGEGKNING